jgi:hypothetical protein
MTVEAFSPSRKSDALDGQRRRRAAFGQRLPVRLPEPGHELVGLELGHGAFRPAAWVSEF